ncbi:DUF2127 domain-containing protein [Leptothrix discophora]|uniref:DUF2127 domain-containing protein n=1 Tax=Leptothrix discophora TaxID=89 RepID=A0ABT9G5Z5_LEPDI|nr:DUF2127 domain-containing protein [Leptothrix discophora]MDP4301826.1 DUF2127 domain-containing protein [Leptothrix discophora]
MRSNPRPLRVIAGLEALKGLLAIALLVAVLHLPARELGLGLANVAGLLGLHPADLAPPALLHGGTTGTTGSYTPLTLLVAAYASVRLLEAWGLWHARRWGVWLGATSGAIYLPFELADILRGPGWLNVSVMAFNAALVGYLTWRLWRQERAGTAVLPPAVQPQAPT